MIQARNIDWENAAVLSTVEKIVGQDYDGKPIFERTFIGTYTCAADSATSIILISGFSGRIISGQGQITAANNSGVLRTVQFGVPYVGTGTGYSVQANSALFQSTGTTRSLQAALYTRYATTNGTYRITVRYTKTS